MMDRTASTFAFPPCIVVPLALAIVAGCGSDEGHDDPTRDAGSGDEPDARARAPEGLSDPLDVVPDWSSQGRTFPTALFTGRVVLPGGSSADPSQYFVESAFGGQVAPGADGTFQIRMNTEATGLLRLRAPDGRTVAFNVFPKHPDLVAVAPELSARSTAIAVTYLAMAIEIREPRLVALFEAYVESRPEFADLVSAVERAMVDGAAVPDQMPAAVARALATLLTGISRTLEEVGGELPDSQERWFEDVDHADRDAVSARVGAVPPFGAVTTDLSATNHAARFVVLYQDAAADVPGGPRARLAGAVAAAGLDVPSLEDLFVDVLLGAAWEYISAPLFSDPDLLAILIERFTEDLNLREERSAVVPLTVPGYERSTVTSYGIGLGLQDAGDRVVVPALITFLTEVIIPWTEVLLDADGLFPVDFAEAIPSLVEILADELPDLALELVLIETEMTGGHYADAISDLADLLISVLVNPDVAALLASNIQILPQLVRDAIVAASAILGVIDAALSSANAVVHTVQFCQAALTASASDAYRLDLTDWDGDGHTAEPFGGDDCDDEDATVFPGAPDPELDCSVDPRCGDGLLDDGEDCDDGNASSTDSCLATCVWSTCGDGYVQDGVEACDDGNLDESDACLPSCLAARCGDGVVRAGVEACDDGDLDESDGCTSRCGPASCGDGFVQAGEACDDGNGDDSDACLSNCTAAMCGDGVVFAGTEACDDGNADDTDACLTDCTPAMCGDGVVEAGAEACDDGNADDTDACLTNCTPATCGDGVVFAGAEPCDDGNADDTDACLTNCTPAMCGDGVVFVGAEECDDGNLDDTDGCLSNCTLLRCDVDGDGFLASVCAGLDCNDSDPTVFPGAPDPPGDCVDQDCDGTGAVDVDSDGYLPAACGGEDCNDAAAAIHPGASDNEGVGIWAGDTVDSTGNTGFKTSLAVDTTGSAHISYYDGSNGDLRYATNASGAWISETVDSAGTTGYGTSLALDGQGAVRISYYDIQNRGLRFASNASGAWVSETIDTGGDNGGESSRSTSLVVGPVGAAHVCYCDGASIELKYASNETGIWVVETVASGGAACGDTSIALDDIGTVYIAAAYGDVRCRMLVATNDGGGWVVEPAPFPLGGGDSISIAVDSTGTLHTVRHSGCGLVWGGLYHSTNASGVWQDQMLEDLNGDDGFSPSLAIDSANVLHVSYEASVPGWGYDPAYATNAGGVWALAPILPSAGTSGADSSIALDSHGGVHVSYYDGTNGDLCYAWRAAPDGVDQNCDGVDGVDADGDAHASVATGGDDCADLVDAVHPGAVDPLGDGVDQNCDGLDG